MPPNTINNNKKRLALNKYNTPLKSFPSSLDSVLENTKPLKVGRFCSFCHSNALANDTHHGRNALSTNYDKSTLCNDDNLEYVQEWQTHEKYERAGGNITCPDSKSCLLQFKCRSVKKCLNNSTCSDLLAAIYEFRNVISNYFPTSRNSNETNDYPPDHSFGSVFNAFEKRGAENRFNSSGLKYNDEQEFFRDDGREQKIVKSGKSVRVQRGCVVEKLFLRSKESCGKGFIPVASRQSFSGMTEVDGSATEDNETNYAPNGQLSQNAILSGMRSLKSSESYMDSNECRLVHLEIPLTQIDNHLKYNPPHAKKSPTLERTDRVICPVKRSGSIQCPAPFQNDEIFLFEEKECKTSHERGLDDGIISPGVKSPRVTQSSASHQRCLSSPINGRKPNMSQNLSPQTPVEGEGLTSPSIENLTGAISSVPLKATPGFKCLRLHDVSPGLFCQRSTCDGQVVNSGDMKDTRKTLCSNSDEIFERKKISEPRKSSEATETGTLILDFPTSTPVKPLTAEKSNEILHRDKLSACEFGAKLHGRLDNKRKSHGAVTKALLNTFGEKSSYSDQSSVVFRSKTNLEPKTPRERRLKARYVNKYNNWTSPASSDDDSPKSKSGKLNSTPRRNSPGFHPYRYSAAQKKSPSLSSPLQALTIALPSSATNKTVRWTSLRQNPGRERCLKYANETGVALLSHKNLTFDACEKMKQTFDPTENSDVIQDCCQGNCTKKFCFKCSMDFM